MPSSTERPTKKLRSCDPDCKIIIKNGSRVEEMEYHSTILANLSSIVDEAFEGDNDNKEIVFEGANASRKIVEKALKFVTDPWEARTMKVENVSLGVVSFYHKYDFAGGLSLCDQVLKEYFEKCITSKESNIIAWNEFYYAIPRVIMAEKYHLNRSLELGLKFLQNILDSTAYPFGCTMYEEDDAKELQPLFVKGLLKCRGIEQKEELESKLFPKLMVLNLRNHFMASRKPQMLTVSGAESKVDGNYRYNTDTDEYEATDGRRFIDMDGELGRVFIAIRNENWSISVRSGDDEYALWFAPHTTHLPYPPAGPWFEDMGDADKVIQIKCSNMRY